jgi:XTP/dITP diphosphohydrolase
MGNSADTILLASSNAGKLREFQAMAAASHPAAQFALFPGFSAVPQFDESAPTFAENAAGKALHYSRFTPQTVLAEDSGLTVTALGGRPGVHSARYAGPGASDAERNAKLLAELRVANTRANNEDRSARFVCVIALADRGRILAVISDCVEGIILDAPRGEGGFGYDPIFFYPSLGKSFAEILRDEKNIYSHRGKAFRRVLKFLAAPAVV